MEEIVSPAYRKMEYLLVIDIPETLRHKIERAREDLVSAYAIRQPRTGRPHIGLVRFTAWQQMEGKIGTRVQEIVMGQSPFLVEFSDYGGYPMHSIFIQMRTKERVKGLIKALKQARSLMRLTGDAPHFFEDPVIPLAARLEKNSYLDAMKEYATRHFNGRFVADSVLMLKREKKTERYQIASRFELKHLPVGIQQGALF